MVARKLVWFGAGFAAAHALRRIYAYLRKKKENKFEKAHKVVWDAIGGALSASQLYLGDRLGLYSVLVEMGTTTSAELAKKTSLNERWIREWLAQQAAMGVVVLEDDGAYSLPFEMGQVLANPLSNEYDISLVQMVPTLVNRARTTLPEAFRTGLGVPYNDEEVTSAIDRAHTVHVRDVLLPKVFPMTPAVEVLSGKGGRCADLGSGGGNLVLALSKKFPEARVEGFEISEKALEQAARNLNGVKNARVVDARQDPLGGRVEQFDVVTTLDVLHDSTDPRGLVDQVFSCLKPGGVWILGDIACFESIRSNIEKHPNAPFMFAVSTCLCMACSLSEPGGAGLGTLGFTVPVAMDMLTSAGFNRVRVLLEEQNTRWFVAYKPSSTSS